MGRCCQQIAELYTKEQTRLLTKFKIVLSQERLLCWPVRLLQLDLRRGLTAASGLCPTGGVGLALLVVVILVLLGRI